MIMGSNPEAGQDRGGQDNRHLWVVGLVVIVGGIIAANVVITNLNTFGVVKKNQEKWAAAHISHYRMVVDFSGYGTYDDMPWTIEVQDVKLVRVTNAQGDPGPADNDAFRFTVNALFQIIEDAYRHNAPSVKVTYDPTYGYPMTMNINPWREPCCQEFTVTVRDFEILP